MSVFRTQQLSTVDDLLQGYMNKLDTDNDGRVSGDEFFDAYLLSSAVPVYAPWFP
jgi:hypothetical protein